MSEEFNDLYDTEDDNTPDGQESQAPKALREYADRTKKENQELRAQIARIESEARESKLVEALNSAGLHPKVAKLVPADITPDGLSDWLAEYGEAFGAQQQVIEQPVSEAAQSLAAVSGAPSGVVVSTPQSDLQSEAAKIDNYQDYMAFLAKHRTVSPDQLQSG